MSRTLVLLAVAIGIASCAQVIGLEEATVDPSFTTGGAGGGGGTGQGAGGGQGGAGANESCTVEPPGAWAFGGAQDQDILSVDVDSDGAIFIAGQFTGGLGIDNVNAGTSGLDGFLAKLDDAGEPVWARAVIGDGTQRVRSIVSDPDGGAVVAGRMQGVINFGSDVLDVPAAATDGRVFFAKYGGDGLVAWAKLPGTYTDDLHRSSEPFLARLPSGDIAFAFAHVGEITLGGSTHTAAQSSVVTGVMTPDGDVAWSVQIDCGTGCSPRRVASDGAAGFFVSGTGSDIGYAGPGSAEFEPPTQPAVDDAFLFHFTLQGRTGTLEAATIWGAAGASSSFQRVVPIGDDVVVFGHYRASQTVPIDGLVLPSTTVSIPNGGDNLFVAVLDDGLRINKLFFSLGTEFSDNETAEGLVVIDDVIVLASRITGTVELDGITETTAGGEDMLIATLSLPNLDVRSVARFGELSSQRPTDMVRRCDGFVLSGDFGAAFELDGSMLEPPEGGSSPLDVFVARMMVPDP